MLEVLDDLKAAEIKMIGNPKERFEEDPVRMIRAVRFKVKLGASIRARAFKKYIE